MLYEYFEKESIPEIRRLGEPEFINRLKLEGRFRRLKIDSTSETWVCTEDKLQALAKARDYMRLVDIPGLCHLIRSRNDWQGDKELAKRIEQGDDLAAAEIEKVLSKIESHLLMTTGSTVRDDVVGAVPNVPAFLSGQPLNMRTRRSAKTGRGPISLFLETTTSQGFTGQDRIGRISAMVALARALAIHRPLNLWLNVTWGGLGKLTQTSIQLETNPIDLTRLAAVLSNLDGVNTTCAAQSRDDCRRPRTAVGIMGL